MAKISEEISNLFRLVRTQAGASTRSVELSDETLCDLLSVAIGDYMERTQNAIIDNNWVSLYGRNLNSTELTYAFTTRSLDMTKDYSY